MTDSLARAYSAYYGALGHTSVPAYSLLHPAFKTSFVLSAGVIDMEQRLAGDTAGQVRSVLVQPCFRHFDSAAVTSGRHLSLFLMGAALYFDSPSPVVVVESLLRFLLTELSLPRDRLWLTTFAGGDIAGSEIPADVESEAVWRSVGLSPGQAVRCGSAQNFWREGANSGEARSGLCGPHAEVFVERRDPVACTASSCRPGCECGRFLEIGNVVFPRYRLVADRLETIPSVLAEAALGLDRVAMVVEAKDKVFDTSALMGYKTEALHGPLSDMSDANAIAIILDHVRSFCCLVAEGARPSAKGRGHILRRLMRDAMRAAGCHSSSSHESLVKVAALLLRHPEACCTIQLASRWTEVAQILEGELQLLASTKALEHRA